MKTVIYFFALIFLCILVASCNRKGANGGPETTSISTFYGSMDECAAKAKSDMLQALSQSGFAFNVNGDDLKAASPGAEILFYEADFNTFLNGPLKSFNAMTTKATKSIIPFTGPKGVVSTATIANNEKGYSIGELFNSKYTNDLNTILPELQKEGPSAIKYIEIPNINVVILEVSAADSVLYFTDMNNGGVMSNIPVPSEKLLELLQSEAQTFQRLNGESLKKNKNLVK